MQFPNRKLLQLRRKFKTYEAQAHRKLFGLYRSAAEKVGMDKLPPLFEFSNLRPLVFTIGATKPVIFLAPELVKKLPPKELEAVLTHELTHIKRRDNLLIWLLELFFVSIPVLIVQVFAISFVFSVQNSVYAILGALAIPFLFKAQLWKRILFLRELSCDDRTVEAIKDPLTLAEAIINVWGIGKKLPKYRWEMGLALTQPLLLQAKGVEVRARRLINYRRPWLKFFLGKAAHVTAVTMILLTVAFLWQFHSTHGHLQLNYCQMGFFFCSERTPLFLQMNPSIRCSRPPKSVLSNFKLSIKSPNTSLLRSTWGFLPNASKRGNREIKWLEFTPRLIN